MGPPRDKKHVKVVEEAHPTPDVLGDFVNGRLDDVRSGAIELHLEHCQPCCEALAELSRKGDRFLSELVSAADAEIGTSAAADGTDALAARGPDGGFLQADELPATVGRFQVRERIGHGGFGEVFLAYDPNLQRRAAIKVPRQGAFLQSAVRERFLREAKASAALDHPNIVTVYEASHDRQLCYIATAYCDGPNLSQWLKSRADPVPVRTAAWLVSQLADGVSHANMRGVLHRDLKPSNVLLELSKADGLVFAEDPQFPFVPKISDFGLAKFQGNEDATQSNVVMGTACYMSPEQAGGKTKNIGPPADVYSLGAILYELLTGRPPLIGESDLETIQQVQRDEPIAPARLRPKTPRDLETICLRCLEKEQRRRYARANELAEDLRRFLAGVPIRARPIGMFEKCARWCGRNPLVATLLGCLAALLVFVAIGSTAMSVRLDQEVRRAVAAQRESKQHLWDSLMASVRVARGSNMMGRRFESMAALDKASRLADELNLGEQAVLRMRDEAIACMTLADLRLIQRWPAPIAGLRPGRVSVDSSLRRIAFVDSTGMIVVRGGGDDTGDGHDELWLDAPAGETDSLTLSPDGNYLGVVYTTDEKPHALLWNLGGPGDTATMIRIPPASCLCFDSFSKAVGLVDCDGTILHYDLASHVTLTDGKVNVAPRGCCFDSQARRIAVWGDNRLEVVDRMERCVTKRLVHPGNDQVQSGAFSPDGQWLATGGSHHVAYIWHAKEEGPVHVLKGHQGWVTDIRFSPDGSLLATSSYDGTTRLWEYWTGREVVTARGYAKRFSRDGRRLASFFETAWATFHVDRGFQRIHCRSDTSSYEANAMDTGPHGLLASFAYGGVDIWDGESGRHLESFQLGDTYWVRFLDDADNPKILTGSERGVQVRQLFRDARRDVDVGGPHSIGVPDVVHRNAYRAALSHDRRTLSVLDGTGVACVVDLSGNQPLRTLSGAHLAQASISARGDWLASYESATKGFELWSAKTGEHLTALLSDRLVMRAEFSPDGRWLAVETYNDVTFLECGSWRQSHRAGSLDARISRSSNRTLSFAPNCKLLAVSRGYKIQLVEVTTGRMLATLPSEVPEAEVCFSRDGSRLACSGPDLTIHIWDLKAVQAGLEQLRLNW